MAIYDLTNPYALRGKSGDKMRSLSDGSMVCFGDEQAKPSSSSSSSRRGRSRKDATPAAQDSPEDKPDEAEVVTDGENQ